MLVVFTRPINLSFPLVQDAIFQVLAAVLHLGNVEFVKGKEVDSSEPKDEKSYFHLVTAAELLRWVYINTMGSCFSEARFAISPDLGEMLPVSGGS